MSSIPVLELRSLCFKAKYQNLRIFRDENVFNMKIFCLALAIMAEMCSVKSNFELNLMPRSETSFVTGKCALAKLNSFSPWV